MMRWMRLENVGTGLMVITKLVWQRTPTLTPKGGPQPALGGGINATFGCCITGITYDEKC